MKAIRQAGQQASDRERKAVLAWGEEGVCPRRASVLVAQRGASQPEQEEEGPRMRRGRKWGGAGYRTGVQFITVKKGATNQKQEKARKNSMVLGWIRGIGMKSWLEIQVLKYRYFIVSI